VELIETPTFTRLITALFTDEEYREFQLRLAANPGLGVRIKGSGGIRKIRVALGGHGKRVGARVIYYWAIQSVALLLPEERDCGSKPQAGCAVGKGSERGVWR
jgi:hypothetical protein